MAVFVDISGFLAAADRDDRLVTHSVVVTETVATPDQSTPCPDPDWFFAEDGGLLAAEHLGRLAVHGSGQGTEKGLLIGLQGDVPCPVRESRR